MPIRSSLRIPLVFAILAFLAGCASTDTQTPFISAEPGVGTVLTSAPRQMRLYFRELPDVSRSTVTLNGPNGSLNLRGLHTMGANDLMMEIYDDVVDGNYTVRWQTSIGESDAVYTGSYSFNVRTN